MGKLQALVTASSTRVLTSVETSQLRADALMLLGFVCSNWNTYMSAQDAAAKTRLCDTKTYISIIDDEVPLVGHKFVELGVDSVTKQAIAQVKKCTWTYSKAKCEPDDLCQYEYKKGDYHLTQSCRLITPQ